MRKHSTFCSYNVYFPASDNTVEPPITDPPMSGQPLYNGHWLWHQLKLLFNQPPTSGRFLIPDSGQAACSQLTNSVQQGLL